MRRCGACVQESSRILGVNTAQWRQIDPQAQLQTTRLGAAAGRRPDRSDRDVICRDPQAGLSEQCFARSRRGKAMFERAWGEPRQGRGDRLDVSRPE